MLKVISVVSIIIGLISYFSPLHPTTTLNLKTPLLRHSSLFSTTRSLMTTTRTVEKAVLAVEQAEGVGARVRRSIGSSHLRNLNPFLMLDHFTIGKGAGFADHPHRGQATVTYMLKGSSGHEDFTGRSGTLQPGDLQWMQAGRGASLFPLDLKVSLRSHRHRSRRNARSWSWSARSRRSTAVDRPTSRSQNGPARLCVDFFRS